MARSEDPLYCEEDAAGACRVTLNANISEFFRDAINDAADSGGIEASFAARSYLVSLLAEYARPGRFADETFARPLTLLLQEALTAQGPERFQRLQSLGDAVLYISGFFRSHLETRGVELKYVSSLGACAYDHAAAMLRRSAPTPDEPGAPDVLSELSEGFPHFAALLDALGASFEASAATRNDLSTLKLYERWARTGSHSIAEILTERGLVPLRRDDLLH